MFLLHLIETSSITKIRKYFVKYPEEINKGLHLEHAVLCREYIIIKLLLEFGANPNIYKPHHYLPLSYIMICSNGESDEYVTKIAKILLKYGADPNLKYPKSAIYLAKIYRHVLV